MNRYIITALALLALVSEVAVGQQISQAPPQVDPMLQATESSLLQQMTAARNWQARAIQLETMVKDLDGQVSRLKDQVASGAETARKVEELNSIVVSLRQQLSMCRPAHTGAEPGNGG